MRLWGRRKRSSRPFAPRSVELVRWAVVVALIGWAPLFPLAATMSAQSPAESLGSLWTDFGVHFRLLVAAPALVFAEAICPRLADMAQHFLQASLIAEPARPRFERVLSSTRRLANSALAPLIAAVLAYPIGFGLLTVAVDPAAWQRRGSGWFDWSPAGLWQLLVSTPLLLVLCLGWFWRVFLWVRFLWLVSRLELTLSAAHPDQFAGLRFLNDSLRVFSTLGFALGALLAGNLASRVVRNQATLADYRSDLLGLAIFIVVVFGGPLMLFSGQLLRAWRRGVYQYGRLAGDVGRQFEKRWLHGASVDQEALSVPDFSAATDLYQIAGNVYGMKLLLIDLRSAATLVLATLLPLLLVTLSSLPRDVLRAAVKMLL